jgi:hypothetical protein
MNPVKPIKHECSESCDCCGFYESWHVPPSIPAQDHC